MPRLDIDRQKEKEPERMEYAQNELEKLGIKITYQDKTSLEFIFKRNAIILFPYSGYFNGKGINAGRGIKNLIEQLTKPLNK